MKGLTAPIIVFTKVVLPEPFGPTIVVISPSLISRETSRKTTLEPYFTLILFVDNNFTLVNGQHMSYRYPQPQFSFAQPQIPLPLMSVISQTPMVMREPLKHYHIFYIS